MHIRRHRHRVPRPAFTLIELMIVIALMGVLAALVISVGSAVRAKAAETSTRAVLKAVQGAIETYTNTFGAPPDDEVNWRRDDGWLDDDQARKMAAAKANAYWLREQLGRHAEARKQLEDIGGDLVYDCNPATNPDAEEIDPHPMDAGSTKEYLPYLLDHWGTPLNYQDNGGAGGTPVVISAGLNRRFDDGDDLRSDDQ
ncbi:MAG: type II secretion system protein [Planctomycetota bacterium]